MMKTFLFAIFCAALVVPVHSIEAGGHPKLKKKPPTTPIPTPTPPGAPSADLAKFMGTYQEIILGPPNAQAPMPRAELAQIRDSFSKRFSSASLADRSQYQLAISVCDAINQAITERSTALSSAAGLANWPARSAQYRTYIQQLMERQKAAETTAAAPR